MVGATVPLSSPDLLAQSAVASQGPGEVVCTRVVSHPLHLSGATRTLGKGGACAMPRPAGHTMAVEEEGAQTVAKGRACTSLLEGWLSARILKNIPCWGGSIAPISESNTRTKSTLPLSCPQPNTALRSFLELAGNTYRQALNASNVSMTQSYTSETPKVPYTMYVYLF
jgi:hypothetical protein